MKKGFWHKLIRGQHGGISPFMFGLLLGVSIFSIAVQKRADIEMDEMRKKQLERQEIGLDNMRKAIELSVMTEGASKHNTYSAVPGKSVASSMVYSSQKTLATAPTGSPSVTATSGDQNQYSRIVISSTADAYVQDSIADLKGDTFSALGSTSLQERSDTAVIDTTSLRNQQVAISYQNMEALAGLVYNWWSTPGNGFQFPSSATYNAEIISIAPYRDFWGNSFVYTRIDQNRASLAFTPPWGGDAYVISLDMSHLATFQSAPTTCPSVPAGCPEKGGPCTACDIVMASSGVMFGFWSGPPDCSCN